MKNQNEKKYHEIKDNLRYFKLNDNFFNIFLFVHFLEFKINDFILHLNGILESVYCALLSQLIYSKERCSRTEYDSRFKNPQVIFYINAHTDFITYTNSMMIEF